MRVCISAASCCYIVSPSSHLLALQIACVVTLFHRHFTWLDWKYVLLHCFAAISHVSTSTTASFYIGSSSFHLLALQMHLFRLFFTIISNASGCYTVSPSFDLIGRKHLLVHCFPVISHVSTSASASFYIVSSSFRVLALQCCFFLHCSISCQVYARDECSLIRIHEAITRGSVIASQGDSLKSRLVLIGPPQQPPYIRPAL
jgi:hypothetical protein